MKVFFFVLVWTFLVSCNNNNPDSDPEIVSNSKAGLAAPTLLSYAVISQYSHDTGAYTQGLQLYKGKMYESTGDYENSSIRITDYKTGRVEQIHKMGTKDIFGEGITILHDKIYQLTWESNVVYVYNIKDITKPITQFKWASEGWGITNNGTDLIISDGVTSNIYFVDPETFRIKTQVGVVDNKGPVENINELEFINGFIYANIYTTNKIVKIDPESGHVVGYMNFDSLLPDNEKTTRTDYFNGIAYDSASKSIFITGKRWPKLYEIRLN